MTAQQDNVVAALAHIDAICGNKPAQHLIGGEWCGGKETFDILCPADNQPIATAVSGTADDADAAANAASSAFPAWRDLDGDKRKGLLHAVADQIMHRAEEIALVESLDCGQPIRFMRKAAIRSAENFRFFADRAPTATDGQSLPTPTHANLTERVPIGPVAVITPWNTPFMLSTWKVAPALASGCTVVHKPAELAPLSAMILADIINKLLPAGAYNLLHGKGEQAGAALTAHPAIKAIAFVGESATGSAIMAKGAATLKRIHFELGGKNPVVIFADADQERAIDAAVFMIYSLNGQRCTSSGRLLAEKSIYDEIIERIAQRANKIKVGHPLDPETELGPLIHPDHATKVASFFKSAKDEGARIVAGGTSRDEPGNYVEPTLLADVTPNMRVAREEIFGPVLSAMPFEDEAEAIEQANNTPYGLTSYVWTSDSSRGMRFAKASEAGMVWINSENVRHLPAPFGGMKASGIGRDGGDWSFEFFMEQKNICIALGDHPIPKLGK